MNNNLTFKVDNKENFRTEYHVPFYKISFFQKMKIFLRSLIKLGDLNLFFGKKILIYNYLGPLYVNLNKISKKVKRLVPQLFIPKSLHFFLVVLVSIFFSKKFLNDLRTFLNNQVISNIRKKIFWTCI